MSITEESSEVEIVGYVLPHKIHELKESGVHSVSMHKPWPGGVPLIRESIYLAAMAAKDAEIAALKIALGQIKESDNFCGSMALRRIATKALAGAAS